ncbi:ParB/RepB/Spo0J family partition protein [Vogesella amnigena]|uniref:ParB/RepB/Spo0J family partition protein n=1 Tax=Vogesella amnigena TaxID=1507449 RepID=A0ABV7TNR0_9NEIS
MAKLKGLGRGLDALLSTVEAADDRLTTLPLNRIRPGKYQPRSFIADAALQELAASIRAQGVIQPVVVREVGLGDYELIAGERRWRASQLAGLQEIPAVVRSVADDAALAMALIENIQREDLDPIEEARGIKRLIDEFALTHEAAAEALGRSRSAVSNLLRLLALPQPLQDMLHQGQLEMGHARALLPLPVIEQVALAQEIVAAGMTVREVEQRVQQQPEMAKPGSKTAMAARRDPDIDRLAELLSDRLGMSVSFRHSGKGRGKLIIDYASLDELDGLLEKLQAKSSG